MSGCFEVSTGDNLESLANVDHKSTWTVRSVVPLVILAPNLETGDRYREEQSGKAKVSVTVHSDVPGLLECLLIDWSEQSMAEVSFT